MCETPSAFVREIRAAKKNHVCCECRGQIFPKESYYRLWGIWNGDMLAFKVCTDCDSLRHRMNDNDIPLEGLEEDVFEKGDALVVQEFLTIKKKRQAKILPWMLESKKSK